MSLANIFVNIQILMIDKCGIFTANFACTVEKQTQSHEANEK